MEAKRTSEEVLRALYQKVKELKEALYEFDKVVNEEFWREDSDRQDGRSFAEWQDKADAFIKESMEELEFQLGILPWKE